MGVGAEQFIAALHRQIGDVEPSLGCTIGGGETGWIVLIGGLASETASEVQLHLRQKLQAAGGTKAIGLRAITLKAKAGRVIVDQIGEALGHHRTGLDPSGQEPELAIVTDARATLIAINGILPV